MGNLTGAEIYFDKILKINPTDQIALDSLNKMQQGVQNKIIYKMTNMLQFLQLIYYIYLYLYLCS
jgi:hypothetical protein